MQLNLGQKIRELRHRDGRTQEALAEALGVTAQAISRWEANGGYPDMEMLPAIANYFHISIDELFGYNADREAKIETILKKAHKVLFCTGFALEKGGETDAYEECIAMLRRASEEFPNEPRILSKLATALFQLGWQKYGAKVRIEDRTDTISYDVEYNSKNPYWQEALRVDEKLLKANPPSEERELAIYDLTMFYNMVGEYEKAKNIAKAQNSVNICKELLLAVATTGDKKAHYLSAGLLALLRRVQATISDIVSLNPSLNDSAYGRKALLSVLNLYETIFIDGRCGEWHFEIGNQYLSIAEREASNGDMQQALAYFDKGFEHCKEYEKVLSEHTYVYSAPLVSKLKYAANQNPPAIKDDFWTNELKLFPEHFCDELRKNEKYSVCFA